MPNKIFTWKQKIRFDRNEFSGSFGDIGTDFPLITGMILASGLDITSTLVMFGLMQIMTGLVYGIPMPVQPLKAMAALVIAQRISGNILYGAGLAIGVIMLLLTVTGALGWVAKAIPKCVVRGIQFGLGLQLAMLALKDYIPSSGTAGYLLAGLGFVIIFFLLGNKRFPPAPFVILAGILYALFFSVKSSPGNGLVGLNLPQLYVATAQDILTGFLLLALPQIPLSICNSIFATRQTAEDFFPERKLSIRKIGLTYSLMNIINPFFCGVPTCHGSGGMAGHFTFGARTGGSVVIYGSFFLAVGLFFTPGFGQIIHFFPKPILGVILLFEGLAMMRLVQDLQQEQQGLFIAFIVGLAAVSLPYGYLVGLLLGMAVYYLGKKKNRLSHE